VLQLFVSIDTAKIMKVKCHSNTTERKRERVKRDVEEEREEPHTGQVCFHKSIYLS
jgi:hypothetical protein